MSELQKFVERLAATLEERQMASLAEALRSALDPPGVNNDFPRMLFRSSEQRMVGDRNEEQAAQAEGFVRSAPAQFEVNYPRWFCEKPTSLGGWKPFDLRRVMLRTPEEQRQFEAVVELADWLEGSVENVFGARGVSLSSLVDERKELLKQMVDREQLELVEEAPGLPYETQDAVLEAATLGGQNPDDYPAIETAGPAADEAADEMR